MASAQTGPAQYLEKFKEQTIACNPYVLAKLGVDKAHCSIKAEGYVIPCVPFQLGFKRFIFAATLTKQEISFFQKYVNTIVGVSLALNPDSLSDSIKFSFRCPLTTIGQMKGRDDMGLFVIDIKNIPDELIFIMGRFLDGQERLKNLSEEYGKTAVKITPDSAKVLGYTMQAIISEPGAEPRRIQIFSISSKVVEHLEPAGAPARAAGTAVAYQFVFKKFRVSAAGTITESSVLPQGIVRTHANLELSPELIEVLDDYYTIIKQAAAAKAK